MAYTEVSSADSSLVAAFSPFLHVIYEPRQIWPREFLEGPSSGEVASRTVSKAIENRLPVHFYSPANPVCRVNFLSGGKDKRE